MLRNILLVATMATTGTAGAWTSMYDMVSSDHITIAAGGEFATRPPAPWKVDDPADSLYRVGREQLNRGDNRRAARTFEQIVQRYPKSTYAGDALYWQAYSLYRIGEPGDLREAVKVLDRQRREYARAATRGDGDALLVRINGALARLGDPNAAERVTERGRTAQQPCARGDGEDERAEALNALMQMSAENAMPILKAVLAKKDECSAGLREKAVFLVSQKRTSETEDILLEVVRNDPSQEVKKKAVFWMGQVNTDRAAQALVTMLETSTVPEELREQAVFALMQQRSERGQVAVRRIAEDDRSPTELRGKAVFWLGQHRSPENAQYLRGLFDKLAGAPEGSSNESIRQKILFSLSQMRGQGNDEWLLQVATNPRH